MSDFVTTLQCLGSLRLTKTWLANGEILSYGAVETDADGTQRKIDAANFHFVEHKIRTFRGMCKLLDMLAGQPRCAVIRGKWAKDVLPTKDEKVRKNLDNFVDYPHYWACLDVDKFEPKTADPVLEPERAIEEYIQSELPPEFHYRACRWQLSSSAGKPGSEHLLKAHLWFWLKTPYGAGALKAWKIAKGIDVDSALFNAVQFHFTANPLFEDGVVDPVPVRSGIIDGFEDEVDLVISESLLAQVKTHDRTGGGIDLPDPTKKRGVIGAFCRAYPIPRVLEEFEVPFEYETPGDNRRLNFLDGGGAPGGAFITPCENYLVNKHNTDPFLNRTTNAFDLVRYYRFGALDDDDAFDADPTSSTSYHRMVELAKTLPEVQAELAAEREAQAAESAAAELELAVADGESILTQLRAMTPEELRTRWVELSMDVGPIAQDRILTHLVAVLQVGRRPLQQTLVQARNARDNAARLAAGQTQLDDQAQGRPILVYQPDSTVDQAKRVEGDILSYLLVRDKLHRYVYFSGLLSHVVEQELPKAHRIDDPDTPGPAVPSFRRMSRVTIRGRAEKAVIFTRPTEGGIPTRVEVPSTIIDALGDMEEPKAPQVSGLVTHPIALQSGRILSGLGFDSRSGLLVWGEEVADCRPYSQEEAREALGRVEANLLAGFEFETPLDKTLALAALFTAVERRAMDQAPAFLISANVQGTGKTTLARRIHVCLTGRDMPTVTYPKSPEEADKLLFTLLLAGPAMVCFDNIKDRETFESSTLNQILTAPYFEQRLLAENKTARVPTDVFFTVTGNHLKLGRDELSRFLEVKLTSTEERPENRTFELPDIVGHGLSIRESVLRDVVGIVAGCRVAKGKAPKASRFTAWDNVVRQPLLWAGGADPAEGFDRNHTHSEETLMEHALLAKLYQGFDNELFQPGDVMELIDPFHGDDKELVQVLQQLSEQRKFNTFKGVTVAHAGRLMSGLVGKWMEIDGVKMRLSKSRTMIGFKYWIRTEFDDM